jgi:predicted ATPase
MAWLVDVAGLNDPALLVPAVAAALGLRDPTADWQVDRLAEHLADMQVLLVLDNCEHVVRECAVLVDGLLRSCPQLRVLATSRQVLGSTANAPTGVVPVGAATGTAHADGGCVAALRVGQPAGAAGCGGAAGVCGEPDNCEAVARPCQRLDGIPLAIELAAVRLRALSVHQVLDRIEDRYGLRTGSPAAIPRQQTLWALIDWSFDLLTAQEPLVACSTPAGLLVVCSRGHGGFRTVVLGSTSRSSIEHAPGLVMVIPSGRDAPWTQRRLDRIR